MAEQEFTTEELESEEWRAVVNYEDYYSVSSLGRVRREKAAQGATVGLILRPIKDRHGYLKVSLRKGNAHHRVWGIHQLVAAAFIGPCPEGQTPNHEDLCPTNNRSNNLNYQTPQGQMDHFRRVGGQFPGAKLGREEVKAIRSQAGKKSGPVLAAEYHLTRSTVNRILARKTWKDVD